MDHQERVTHCPECGTELQSAQVEFAEADFSEGKTGTPIMRDFCPNPDCSRHEVAPKDLPGSLGGDHGGG